MKMLIRDFQEITKEDVETAGGKGANLGEMTMAGIPVPAGFVLTSGAYLAFLKENGLEEWIRERFLGTYGEEKQDTAKLLEAAEEIRKRILGSRLPRKAAGELLERYRQMGAPRVAVRSSATAEDLADASFAGQQETYLNVCGEEALLQKVLECYASLWGDRAVVYRQKQGYDSSRAAIAVVIQQMVESDGAGVLFTVNPSTGNKEEMQINASYGLGEAVVSGRVTPDEYICDRNGAVKSCILGSKEMEIVYDSHGTKEIPVSEERRRARALTEREIKKLVDAALRVEAHYGTPMDIEWAVKDGVIYILQARAITTLNGKDPCEDIQIGKVSRRIQSLMTFMLEKNPFAYYPLDYDLSMILGVKKEELLSETGINMDMEMKINEKGIMYLPSGKISLNGRIFGIGKTLREWLDDKRNEEEGRARLKVNQKRMKELWNVCVESSTLKECGELFQKLYAIMEDNGYARFRYGVFPSMLVGRKLERVVKKCDKTLSAYDLLGDLEYKTAQINKDLEALAGTCYRAEGLRKDILEGKSWQEITGKYPEIQSDLQAFLDQNGHKSDFNCYCLIAKSWNEDRDRLLKVLRPMVLAMQEGARQNQERKNKEKYQSLLDKMKEQAGMGRWRKLEEMIAFYRFAHVYREDTQYLWEEAFELCRRVYRRIQQLLKEELEHKDDLLYLFFAELMTVCAEGSLGRELYDKIELRRSSRPLAEKIWEKSQLTVLKTEGDSLKGIGGSSGEAAGTVCIVTSPDEFYKLQKGQVLVCKYTDPEWAPLFTLAAAVVSDTGGSLSHAAIVAREYGIPAVLGTGSATRVLKDGDRVLVDGTGGEVRRVK